MQVACAAGTANDSETIVRVAEYLVAENLVAENLVAEYRVSEYRVSEYAQVTEFDFSAYMSDLQRRLKEKWGNHPATKNKLVVQFTVAPDGAVSNLALIKSSGVDAIDQHALNTVTAASPLAPLPKGEPPQTIQFIFDYAVFGGTASETAPATSGTSSGTAAGQPGSESAPSGSSLPAARTVVHPPAGLSREELILQARKFASQNDIESALEFMKQALLLRADRDLFTEYAALDKRRYAVQRIDSLTTQLRANDTADLHCQLGEAWEMAGDNQKAAVEFQKSLNIEPGYKRAQDGLKRSRGI